MPENKTQPTKASVTDFIAAIADETKRGDAKKLVKLMRDASGEKPYLWGPSIVGFGSRHYRYDSGREGDMPVLAFSPRKAAMVLYGLMITSAPAVARLKKLGKHTAGKGCVYVKKLADVDEKVLCGLFADAVAAKRE